MKKRLLVIMIAITALLAGCGAKNENTEIIDRVLSDYNYEPVAWSNTFEFKEDADIFVKIAEDSTGRYKELSARKKVHLE